MDIKLEHTDDVLSSKTVNHDDCRQYHVREDVRNEFGRNDCSATVKMEEYLEDKRHMADEAIKIELNSTVSKELMNIKEEEEEMFHWRNREDKANLDHKDLKIEKFDSGECSDWTTTDRSNPEDNHHQNYINSSRNQTIPENCCNVKREDIVDDKLRLKTFVIEIPPIDNPASSPYPLLKNSQFKPSTSSEDIQLEENEILEHFPVVVVINLEKNTFFEQNFVCRLCFGVFPSFSSLALHKTVHNKSKLGNRVELNKSSSKKKTDGLKKCFKCDLCQFQSEYKSSLKTHKLIHTGEKPYVCDQCGYECARLSILRTHMLSHTGERPFQCEQCNYKSTHKHTLKLHQMTHTGEKPYECDVCSYKSSQKSCLLTHKLSHTTEKPFKCSFCNYTCKLESYLKKHIRVSHSYNKVFKCDLCVYNSECHSTFELHRAWHAAEGSFNCDVCDYMSARRYHLKRHKMIHSGERPFECDICDYKSTERSSLNKHKFSHTNEKPFQCDECNFTTAYKSNMKKHRLKHSTETANDLISTQKLEELA